MTIETQFKDASAQAGIIFDGPITADGKLHRCHLDGHKAGSRNGAYILHLDGIPAGWALDYKSGQSFTWRSDGGKARLSQSDLANIEALKQQRQAERKQANLLATEKALWIWSRSKPIAHPAEHPYLVKKQIQPHGTRLSHYQDSKSLVIPIINQQAKLTSLQFIDEDGSKRFLPGGELKGCFMGIGSVDMNKAQDKPGNILICEGFATGASLCEWYRQPVIVAFNAGNLEPVAKVIRELYPDSTLIICGDNDPSGVGQDSARKAALACSGRYLLPPKVGIDFNDLITIWRSNRVVA